MNIPELIEMIHENLTGQDIRYVVDMLEVHQDIPDLRVMDHAEKQLFGSEEVIPFLFDCDTSLWELEDWTLPNFQYEQTMPDLTTTGSIELKPRMRGTVKISLRRYNV